MVKDSELRVLVGSSQDEIDRKQALVNRLRNSPIPNREILDNIGLYLSRQALSRINFIQKIYQMIIPVHGVIMEFGVRWGQNIVLFSNLRGIHEPYNYNRKIIGFDTFEGFPSVSPEDGDRARPGDYDVVDGWIEELEAVLEFHNQNAPISNKKKHELIKGDATITLPQYLMKHPETIIALAYFDFDLFAPTRDCLNAIIPHLTKGSILAFDELNMPELPGETLALREVIGLSRYAIRRDPSNPMTSYLVVQ